MEANELRIGNYVYPYADNKYYVPVKVESINSEGINICLFMDQIDEDYQFKELGSEENQLSPIPLTEEWLVKLGFKKITDNANSIGDYSYYKYKGVETSCIGKYGITIDGADSILIKHVHQLQNLYHALTGEELKYNG